MLNKYYNYFLYVLCYFALYFHNQKEKILSIVEPITVYYSTDYIILIIIEIIFFGHILKKYKEKKFIKKNWNYFFCSFLIINTLMLIIYNYLNLRFNFKFIYNIEFCFFNVFGLLGLLIPLIYLNELILFFVLFFLVSSFYILKFLGLDVYFLGYWSSLSIGQWGLLLLLLIIYIFMTVMNDIYKVKNNYIEENINHEFEMNNNENTDEINNIDEKKNKKNIIKKKEKSFTNQEPFFNEEIIREIYCKDDVESIELQEQNLTEELLKILKIFSIKGQIYKVLKSYMVTNYFFKPEAGTKMSRIESVEGEISMELGKNVRVTNNLQGVIFEISNEYLKGFSFADIWSLNHKCELPLFLGFDSLGAPVIIDLTKQPHILMCGTTGSGKSSTLHCLINSLMTTLDPLHLKFVLIDPKILELSVYKNSKHLFVDIVTNLDNATEVLEKLIKEMENRYKKMSQFNQRSIKEYNKKVKQEDILPYLVCVIEEFADLALYKNNNFKHSVQRIAQMGRAAGLHLIIATQRPSVNVIDGVIKANFPTRIALKVANKMESRIILDASGAERMERPGEMLLLDISGNIRRVIAPYIGEDAIENLMNYFLKK